MITDDEAHAELDELIKRKEFTVLHWQNTRYMLVKVGSATETGNLGKDLLRNLLVKAGYENAEISEKGRHGEWDVSCKGANGEARFEVKVATQDVSGSHQFNGIRRDTGYTHLFLLGVMYEKIHFLIIAKSDLNKYTLTPMRKGTSRDFKNTLLPSDLYPFNCFTEEIEKVLGPP